jgi:hypothetical protein
MRTNYIFLGMALLLTGTVNATVAQTYAPKKQPYFAPKRVLIVPMTRPTDKNKTLSRDLESTTGRSLRNLFSGPQYYVITEKEALSALLPTQKDDTRISIDPPTEPTPAEITEVMVRMAKKAGADTVIVAMVRDASSRQVTLALWNIDVKTGKAAVEGQVLRRAWSDYPKTESTSDGGWKSSVTLPPMDTDDQKRLITQMLTEWSAGLQK